MPLRLPEPAHTTMLGVTGGQVHDVVVSGPMRKPMLSTPKAATHRNWKDDLSVASQVSNVAVQGHPLLNSPSLADCQGHSQNGVGTEFSWIRKELNGGIPTH